MNRIFLLALLPLFLASCGGSKTISNTNDVISIEKTASNSSKARANKREKSIVAKGKSNVIVSNENASVLESLIDYAKSFEGTRYKFGGTTDKGMDCSGLVYTVFKEQDVLMPRISRDMASKGIEISLREVSAGDLVFFKTSSRSTINHVGLVVESKGGEIFFIHSTTSRGVIISSMEEDYWKKAFVAVRRII
ncbi:cell wall-associated NlpC family hydrolase [Ulvibacter sp. MAR_2010_11]|uniref:C40 family peptidase n=1 Tax=Ulvibacter sp. MAR_2010_11 TaxID=1250229 RepID=UPI000C2BB859|nr:C40 family peptidase [Ulvibacter sp. MAR_2010_11]PKA82509.1 cell wall-associated NlpC family hydrolase [Ulvibacter sp. MAR_2010_11]